MQAPHGSGNEISHVPWGDGYSKFAGLTMAGLSSARRDVPLWLQGRCLRLLAWASMLLFPCTLPPYASAQNPAGKTGGGETHATWRSYGGSQDGSQYSSLHQIDRSNIKKLQIAWTYRTGDDRKYAFNPLVIDGTM